MIINKTLKVLLKEGKITQEQYDSVDSEIKASTQDAVTKRVNNLKTENETLKLSNSEKDTKIAEYASKEGEASLLAAFVKNGGKEDRFEAFKKVAGDTSELDESMLTDKIKGSLTEFPSLGKVIESTGEGNQNLEQKNTDGEPDLDAPFDWN